MAFVCLWLGRRANPLYYGNIYLHFLFLDIDMALVNGTLTCRRQGPIYPALQKSPLTLINTLRPRKNGRYFANDIFKCLFFNEHVWIPIKISLKGPINNIPALVQIMAWRRPGDKPLSGPMMVRLLPHIYALLGLNELTLIKAIDDTWRRKGPRHQRPWYWLSSAIFQLQHRKS